MSFSVSTPSTNHQSRFSQRISLPKKYRFPEYIYQTHTGLLIFRIKVPRDCRPHLNKKELQYSLRTRCVYSARKHIASILPFLHGIFEGIRQGIYSDLPRESLCQSIKKGISTINKPMIRDFKSILGQLPPNMQSGYRYKDKNIPEIIAMKPEKTLGVHTINRYLSRI